MLGLSADGCSVAYYEGSDARLQAASVSGKPVLLRVAGDSGHGQGMALSSAIELDADVFAFLFDQLGVP